MSPTPGCRRGVRPWYPRLWTCGARPNPADGERCTLPTSDELNSYDRDLDCGPRSGWHSVLWIPRGPFFLRERSASLVVPRVRLSTTATCDTGSYGQMTEQGRIVTEVWSCPVVYSFSQVGGKVRRTESEVLTVPGPSEKTFQSPVYPHLWEGMGVLLRPGRPSSPVPCSRAEVLVVSSVQKSSCCAPDALRSSTCVVSGVDDVWWVDVSSVSGPSFGDLVHWFDSPDLLITWFIGLTGSVTF